MSETIAAEHRRYAQLRAELSEALDVIEALVLSGGYLGSKPMQRADEFVRRMKKQEIGGGV